MLGSLLGMLLVIAPADEPSRVEVHWDAPPECPDATKVRAMIDALVGGEADIRASGYVVMQARLARADEQWSMDFRIETTTGARIRRWTAATCEELTEIAAVVTAVTMDSALAADALEPATDVAAEPQIAAPGKPTSKPATAPPRVATRSAEPARVPAKPRAQARAQAHAKERSAIPEGAILAGGALEYGALPGVAGGFAGAFALAWPHARMEVGAAGWLPRSQRLSGTEARAEVGLWHVDARGCGVPKVRRVEFPLCAGVEVGAMVGRGRGLAVTMRRRLPWVAAEAGAMMVARVTPHVAIVATGRLVIPLLRPGFELDGEVVHRAARFAFVGVLGIEGRWRWPSAARARG